MIFWNWGPTTIWHNLASDQFFLKKSLHPCNYDKVLFILKNIIIFFEDMSGKETLFYGHDYVVKKVYNTVKANNRKVVFVKSETI